MEEPSTSTKGCSKRPRPRSPRPPLLGLWTIDPARPLRSTLPCDLPHDSAGWRMASPTENSFLYPDLSLQTSLPYPMLVNGNEDEEMTDIEDWALMFGAANEKPTVCGACGYEWDEDSGDGDVIGCDGGYCTNSWYHRLCRTDRTPEFKYVLYPFRLFTAKF
jgi:hypothetical protein